MLGGQINYTTSVDVAQHIRAERFHERFTFAVGDEFTLGQVFRVEVVGAEFANRCAVDSAVGGVAITPHRTNANRLFRLIRAYLFEAYIESACYSWVVTRQNFNNNSYTI